MQSDFLQLAIAFAGYVCIGFCVYMFSRKMLVDIDPQRTSRGDLSMDFLWRGLAIRDHVCCNISSDVDIHPSR
ncbi:Uncharacterised protein [Escherichia coli]|nr:Uncharacterised protein [Escherichia coli]